MDVSGPARGPTGTAQVAVRPARPGDAAAIARVQEVTWRTAYRAVLPAELLDTWDDDAAVGAWQSAVVAPPSSSHGVFVALERDLVVGFAAFGPAPIGADLADPAGTVELATLLVEPRWGRRGHGSRLLAAVADLARERGDGALRCWLPETDRVSARFLESAGWAPAGWARTLDTGGTPLRELLWHTSLTDAAGGRDTDDREETR